MKTKAHEKDGYFMKKRIFSAALGAILITAVFAGCTSNSNTLKDGTYHAQMKEASHGWTDYVEITVKDGKFDTVVYDSKNDSGDKKSLDEDYKKSMMEGNKNAGKAETYPADYSKKLADSLLEKQDISQVDTVAGATNSSKNFKAMVEALKSNMSKGKTDTVLVDAPTE